VFHRPCQWIEAGSRGVAAQPGGWSGKRRVAPDPACHFPPFERPWSTTTTSPRRWSRLFPLRPARTSGLRTTCSSNQAARQRVLAGAGAAPRARHRRRGLPGGEGPHGRPRVPLLGRNPAGRARALSAFARCLGAQPRGDRVWWEAGRRSRRPHHDGAALRGHRRARAWAARVRGSAWDGDSRRARRAALGCVGNRGPRVRAAGDGRRRRRAGGDLRPGSGGRRVAELPPRPGAPVPGRALCR